MNCKAVISTGLAIVVAAALFTIGPSTAKAKKMAAKDLKCADCVDSSEIVDDTIGLNDLNPNIRSFLNGFPGSPDQASGRLSRRCPDGKFVGEVWLFAGDYEPAGTAFAHGQLFDININDPNDPLLPLAKGILRDMYGGDGVTTFALPDLRGLEPAGMNYVICMIGIFPSQND